MIYYIQKQRETVCILRKTFSCVYLRSLCIYLAKGKKREKETIDSNRIVDTVAAAAAVIVKYNNIKKENVDEEFLSVLSFASSLLSRDLKKNYNGNGRLEVAAEYTEGKQIKPKINEKQHTHKKKEQPNEREVYQASLFRRELKKKSYKNTLLRELDVLPGFNISVHNLNLIYTLLRANLERKLPNNIAKKKNNY